MRSACISILTLILLLAIPAHAQQIACQIGVAQGGKIQCAEPHVKFSTQPWQEYYACYYMYGNCGRKDGICQWQPTQDLASCVHSPTQYRQIYEQWKQTHYLSPIPPEKQMLYIQQLESLLNRNAMQRPVQAPSIQQQPWVPQVAPQRERIIQSPSPIIIKR